MSDTSTPRLDESDRHFALAALALRSGLLTAEQFAAACIARAASPRGDFGDFLVEQGYLQAADRERLAAHLVDKPLPADEAAATLSIAASDDPLQINSTVDARDVPVVPAPGRIALTALLGGAAEAVGHYTLTHLHATGGIGRVWLARDADLDREVALKELRPERADNAMLAARFLQEARVTGQLEHPGIVPIYTLGRKDANSQPFYTMRFIRGRTLTEAVKAYHEKRRRREDGPLDRAELLQAFVAVCHVTAYAHSRGVIHRDLKGQNIILGDFGEVVVLDWGLARRSGDSTPDADATHVMMDSEGSGMETREGQVVGTPAYMAPEQGQGRLDLLGPRTDVYGLGAILYEILTGRPPFHGNNTQEVLRKVAESEPERPRQLDAGAPPALEAICLRALAKEPDNRYPAAGDLARDVQCWLADEPVSVYPEPLPARVGRWTRRHKPLVAAAAGLLVAAVVGLSIGTALIAHQQKLTDAARADAVANFERAEGLRKTAQEHFDEAERQRKDAVQQRAIAETEKQRAETNATEATRQKQIAETNAAEATRQKQRAEANFQKARDAVDKMLTRVGEDRLRHIPQMEKLRKELLEEALKFNQGFLQEKSDDPQVRREAGIAHGRVGHIYAELGNLAEAENAFQLAIPMLKELADKHRDDPTYQHWQANTENDYGLVLEGNRQYADAEKQYRKAIALLEDLRERFPGEPLLLPHLANSHSNRGSALQMMRRNDDALKAYGEAEKIRRRLYDSEPKNPNYREQLGKTHYNYGNLYYELRQLDEAEKAYRAALPLFDALVEEFPEWTEYRDELANTIENLGNVLFYSDRLELAEEHFRRAIGQWEKLSTEYPSYPNYRRSLAGCYYNLGNIRRDSMQFAEAEKPYLQAVAILEKLIEEYPLREDFRDELAHIQMDLGTVYQFTERPREAEKKFALAFAFYRRKTEREPDDPKARRHLAGVLFNRGNLHKLEDEPAEAEKLYREALPMQRKLHEKDPARRDYREDLATTLVHLGNVCQETGRLEEAEKLFDEAKERWSKLVEDYPDAPYFRRMLGVVYYNTGNLLVLARKLDEAEKSYRLALAEQEKLLKRYPGVQRFLDDRANAWIDLGNVLQDTQRPKEAEQAFRDALRHFEEAAKKLPDVPEYPARIGMVRYNLGNLLSHTDRAAESKELYAQSIEGLTKLVERYPKVVRYQIELAEPYNNLAMLLADNEQLKLRDPAKAVEAGKKAVALTKTNGGQWNTLGICHYRNGEWKAALEAFDLSMKYRNGGDAYDWYFMAMAHQQQGDKDKARKWYDRAVEWTKKNSPNDPELNRWRAEAAKLLEVAP